YADHFLQDSYCAGHMGFNRSASSIAATSAFHDLWNKRGRTVRNRAGETWVTRGDSYLNSEANQEGRRRVILAATMSAYGFVATFVNGAREHAHELEIWRQLPYLIGAPSVPALLGDG